jgi:hypothetical protein
VASASKPTASSCAPAVVCFKYINNRYAWLIISSPVRPRLGHLATILHLFIPRVRSPSRSTARVFAISRPGPSNRVSTLASVLARLHALDAPHGFVVHLRHPPLLPSIAILSCHPLLPSSIAILHCHPPLPSSFAFLLGTPLRFSPFSHNLARLL